MIKRLLLVAGLALGLSGCAALNVLDPGEKSVLQGGTSITASIENPVTPQMLYQLESAMTVVMSGLVTYRRLCVQGAADANCRDRIRAIQPYTRRARVLLADLRVYVRTNDRVSALSTFNALRALVADIQRVKP